MDKALLGLSPLKYLKFYPSQHIKKVRDEIANKYVSDLNCQGFKLVANSYKGIRYQFAHDDPVAPTETVTSGFGKETK